MRAVLDVDPGIDDALAILLALASPEIEIAAVSTVAGNVDVERGCRNALAVLEAAGSVGVRVYRGAARPLARRLLTASFFHGEDGLGGVRLADARASTDPLDAARLLVQQGEAAGERLTVIALGPLTNLARACQLDSGWAARLERIVISGGAVGVPGNVSPVAEANVYADPEAAAIVLGSGAPITLVGLDVTETSTATRGHLEVLRPNGMAGRGGVLALELLWAYVGVAERVGAAGAALHDPLAVAVACQPDLVRSARLHVEVELEGGLTRGQTVAWRTGRRERIENRGDHDDVVGIEDVPGQIDVALDVDAERFRSLFFERLALGPS